MSIRAKTPLPPDPLQRAFTDALNVSVPGVCNALRVDATTGNVSSSNLTVGGTLTASSLTTLSGGATVAVGLTATTLEVTSAFRADAAANFVSANFSGTVTANALTASSLTISGATLPSFPINLGGSGVTGVLPYTSAGLKGFVQSSDFSPYVNIPIYELSSGTSSQVLGVSPGSNAWALTGSLATARYSHSAVLLNTGKAMVVGGIVTGAGIKSCELYDPTVGTWSNTGNLTVGRGYSVVSSLSSGKVLAASGVTNGTTVTATCEIYDPLAGTWSNTGSVSVGRYNNYISGFTVLSNGKVLIVGGFSGGVSTTATCEIYDPSVGTWSSTGSISSARHDVSVILLANGKALASGGQVGSSSASAICQLYDPSVGTWSNTGSLNTARHEHSSILLSTGKVLIVGGVNSSGTEIMSCELYDPSTGICTATGSLNLARQQFQLIPLPNGKILAVAGYTGAGGNLKTCEIYDPLAGTWALTGSTTKGRGFAASVLLPNGKVLVTAGEENITGWIAFTELFSPLTVEWKTLAGVNVVGLTNTSGVITISGASVVGSYNANYTLVTADRYVMGNASSLPLYFTLPSSTNVGGELHTVKKVDSSSNAVVVKTAVGNSLDGATASFLTSQYQTATFLSDNGNNWYSMDSLPAEDNVSARYYASSTSLSGSLATISWTTKDYDTSNGMSAGTYTVPVAGKYQVNSGLLVTGTIALNNTIVMEIQKNASVVSRNTLFAGGIMTDLKGTVSDIISCNVGDTLQIQASTSVTGPSIVSSNFDNYISLARVSA